MAASHADVPARQQPEGSVTDAACARWLERFERGPVRTRWTVAPVQPGDPAPSRLLVDARRGERTALERAWADGPALLLFWRHFGCCCGRDRAGRLIEEMDLYRTIGAQVVIIAQGEPERAQHYMTANSIPDDVAMLLDSTEECYREYGIVDCGPLEVLYDAPDEFLRRDMRAARDLAEARKSQGMPLVDNPWLLPAEFVVAQSGQLVYVYRYQFCENWIDPRVHVAAIRAAHGEIPRY